MHKTIGGGLLAFALVGAVIPGTLIVSAGAAHAAATVTFNMGDVAFGYSDGYWDKSHTWHKWKQASHRQAYQKSEGNQYHEWAHTRDADKGWHESGHDDHK